jgi:hypothetical protein
MLDRQKLASKLHHPSNDRQDSGRIVSFYGRELAMECSKEVGGRGGGSTCRDHDVSLTAKLGHAVYRGDGLLVQHSRNYHWQSLVA